MSASPEIANSGSDPTITVLCQRCGVTLFKVYLPETHRSRGLFGRVTIYRSYGPIVPGTETPAANQACPKTPDRMHVLPF